MLTTSEVAEKIGIARQNVLARAENMRIKPARVYGRTFLWTTAQYRRLVAAPRAGRPRKGAK